MDAKRRLDAADTGPAVHARNGKNDGAPTTGHRHAWQVGGNRRLHCGCRDWVHGVGAEKPVVVAVTTR